MPPDIANYDSTTMDDDDSLEENTIEVATDDPRSPTKIRTAINKSESSHTASEHGIPTLDGAFDSDRKVIVKELFDRQNLSSEALRQSALPSVPMNGASADPKSTTFAQKAVHDTLSTSLAPKSGALASQYIPATIHSDHLLTDSDPEFRNSTPLSQPPPRSADVMSPNPSFVPPPPQGYYSTYKLESGTAMPPPQREPKTSSRRVKQYTLSDGTVVSGKGLGRGRPGVKRGPRNPKYSIVDADDLPSPVGGSQSPSASTASRKRKRTDSNASNIKTTFSASTSTSGSRDSSPEYNPTEETRFGRKTQKPTSIVPVPESASPASRRPKLETANSVPAMSPSTLKHHPKIKRRIYRGREQLALCEHCLRGHGPPGNVILFCDACNKCWHQRCHDPQVPQSVIADTKANWFCSGCDRILHGKKAKKAALAKVTSIASEASQPAFAGPLIGGSALNHAQKQSYLNSLSKDKLVSLILSASELAPALPLFQAPAPQLPQAKFTSNYTTPVSSNAYQNAPAPAEDDEGYDSHFDEHAYLYPKPGHGIKLPPESTDLQMLLESKASRTFSHWVRGMVGQEFSGSGDVMNGGMSHAHG